MKLIILILLSILPTIVLWEYVNSIDKNKEPSKVLIKLFFAGILSVVFVLVLNLIISLFSPDFISYEVDKSIKGFLFVFFCVALIEELGKFLMVILFGWHDKNLDETYDVILYSMIVALGFATVENLLYSIEGGVSTAILRIFTAVPGHVIDGAFMGYFLLLYRLNKNKKINLFLALLIPCLSHTLYDFIVLSTETIIGLLIFLAFTITEFVIAYCLVSKAAKNSKSLFQRVKFNYCPNCGNPASTNYCPNCGNKLHF